MSTVFRVEKTANYTVMSNTHLKDRRLSYKSKGLLSVILSLPPEWDYTITGLAVIATDGVDSVKTAIKELEKYGYVTRSQLRDERGRMAQNEYFVYENPSDNPDFVSADTNDTTADESKKQSLSMPKNCRKANFYLSPSTDKPLAENPSTDNPATDTIIKLNNNILNIKKSNHSFNPPQECGECDRNERNDTQTQNDFSVISIKGREFYRSVICENINYFEAFAPYAEKRDDVNELVSIMTDVVCSSSPTIRVNGEFVSQEVVKSRFLKLTEEEIDYVLYALKHNSSRIGNMRSYLITALYNSKSTMCNYYANMAYNDMRCGVM